MAAHIIVTMAVAIAMAMAAHVIVRARPRIFTLHIEINCLLVFLPCVFVI
jgi:hypothetical protein